MISFAQQSVVAGTPAATRQRAHQTDAAPAFQPPPGTREVELWGEVLLRAIEDFRTYMGHKNDPENNPLSAKMLRSIVADGCDPEYWIFGNNTGFDAVCMVLNLEPDCIRRYLRGWLRDTYGVEPSY